MNKRYMKKTIKDDVIPRLDEILKQEGSGLAIYVEYDDKKTGVMTTISPAPDLNNVEEVVRQVAREVYKNTERLPTLIIGCERITYAKFDFTEAVGPIDMNNTEDGIIIVALEASTATGFATLYSLPDMEEMTTKDIDKDSDDAPPYTMTAIAHFMDETLQSSGLIEKKEREEKESVQFKFSRN
jgi:hypothetical protein